MLKPGGVAEVCALHLPGSERSTDDLVEGVELAMPPEMAQQMLDPTIRTVTF
ncbi:MAG: hypothetical protein WCZ18_03300 [Ottowia sp.]|nr:hypothetical protein [Ottowia sp.]